MVRNIQIEELRKKASVAGKERTWISGLTDDQIYEVFTRLKNGESAKSIAKHVREAWQINAQSSVHSISQGILKFSRRIAHLLINPSPCRNDFLPNPYEPENEDKTPGDTLEEIADQQESRIKRIISEEKETGVKYLQLSKEIMSLTNLRKAIIKQREWELKHGDAIKNKRIQRMGKDIKKNFDKIIEDLGDDGRERIISAVKRFMELAEKEAITPEVKPD